MTNFWAMSIGSSATIPGFILSLLFVCNDTTGRFSCVCDRAPLNSLRLKVFYDALQDMRALQLLESFVGKEKTLALLEEGLSEPITFSSYPRSEDWQLAKREQINAAIKKQL